MSDTKCNGLHLVLSLIHICALKYSGVYEMMPKSMRQYLESCQNSEVGQILKILAELTESTGFESAVNTVNQALQYQVTDSDSLKSLYRRLYMDCLLYTSKHGVSVGRPGHNLSPYRRSSP